MLLIALGSQVCFFFVIVFFAFTNEVIFHIKCTIPTMGQQEKTTRRDREKEKGERRGQNGAQTTKQSFVVCALVL